MYVVSHQPNQWGPFRRPVSQKITPLVQFYEKSAKIKSKSSHEEQETCTEFLGTHPSMDLSESLESLDDLSLGESMEEYISQSTDDEDEDETAAKKSQTCPDLSTCTSDQPVKPRARERMTRVFGKGQMHFKRTATWIGLPVQKLLTSPPIQNFGNMLSKKYQSAADNMLRLQMNFQSHLPRLYISKEHNVEENDGSSISSIKPFANEIEQHTPQAARVLNKKIFVAPKRIMHCRVMQIINVGSDRDCEYEMSVYYNGKEQISQRGTLHKVDKSMSADRPQEEAMRFEIQEPFSLSFQVSARYTNTRFQNRLIKLGLWPTVQKSSIIKNLPLVGSTMLKFESKQDTKHHGIIRFKLTKMHQRKEFYKLFNIELVVDINITEELPPSVQKFPWAYTLTNSALTTCESMQNSDIVKDPAQVRLSQRHCQSGDYLTIYTRGLAHPAWKRYWVVMEGHQLLLYDFTFKITKGPMHVISLLPLLSVDKPSLDDCDNVGIARKIGIMLQFDRLKTVLGDDVRFDDGEVLEGKAFVYCDDETNANHWRRALIAYTTSENKAKENEDSIDLRFLW
ncbi:hypothetical protein G6F63_005584 [Rhizopus arrhizus]|nr:hypothetical protein G6F63_005584 [Rhizopus arrhizus]